MNCPVCGTTNEAGAAFCYKCGSALQTGNASAAPATGHTVDLSRDPLAEREQPPLSPEAAPTPREQRSAEPPRENPWGRPIAAEPPSLPLEGNARVYPSPRLPVEGNVQVYPSPPAQPYIVDTPLIVSRTSTLATISLVFGILSWIFLPVIGAIAAIITGHMGRREIQESGGQMTGGGLATAGLILGYLNLALALIGFALLCVVFGWLASV